MRISFITLGYQPLRTSGLDLSGERLVKAMLQAGHQVTVIAGAHKRFQETHVHPNLKIYRIPLDRSDWFGFGWRAARLLDRLLPFDVTHFWDVHFGWAYHGRFMASLQHSFRQRINSLGQITVRNVPTWIYRYGYYSAARIFAEQPAIQRASGLLAGSCTTRDEFIEEYQIDPKHIALARHGIDTDFFHPISITNGDRQRNGLDISDPVLVFAGFITPRKGLEYLAMALPLVKPAPKLLIIGKWRNETYHRQVMSVLEPVKDQVIEIGFVPDEELPFYFSLADIYVSSSLLEGFGLPIGEALACQTPVVAMDSGSIAEVMGPGGFLVAQRDVKGLADSISTLLQNSKLRREMGERGREFIERELSIKVMLDSTLNAYEKFR